MEQPKSTVENPLAWRLWHSINYMIGGVGFLIGSALLFPFFNNVKIASPLSAWLYTIGSLTFLLADITEWTHFFKENCPYLRYVINFFLSVIGSGLYLIGSALFLPQINQSQLGFKYFIYGSCFVMVSQTWKLARGFY